MDLFRPGQWVRGRLPDALAKCVGDPHRIDGDFVGIYHPSRAKARVSVNDQPATEEHEPETVTLVRPDGTDCPLFLKGAPFQTAKLHPAVFEDLRALTTREELPPDRVFAPGFCPRP